MPRLPCIVGAVTVYSRPLCFPGGVSSGDEYAASFYVGAVARIRIPLLGDISSPLLPRHRGIRLPCDESISGLYLKFLRELLDLYSFKLTSAVCGRRDGMQGWS